MQDVRKHLQLSLSLLLLSLSLRSSVFLENIITIFSRNWGNGNQPDTKARRGYGRQATARNAVDCTAVRPLVTICSQIGGVGASRVGKGNVLGIVLDDSERGCFIEETRMMGLIRKTYGKVESG